MNYLKYLTIPYNHLGRDFDGCDCLGFIKLFYQHELGVSLTDFIDYDEFWYRSSPDFFVTLHQQFGFQSVQNAAVGDVVFIVTGKKVTHCGVVVDPSRGYFLHMTRHGAALHTYKYGQWAARLSGFYRYQGIL